MLRSSAHERTFVSWDITLDIVMCTVETGQCIALGSKKAKVIQAGIEPTTACVLCKTGVITTTPLNRRRKHIRAVRLVVLLVHRMAPSKTRELGRKRGSGIAGGAYLWAGHPTDHRQSVHLSHANQLGPLSSLLLLAPTTPLYLPLSYTASFPGSGRRTLSV